MQCVAIRAARGPPPVEAPSLHITTLSRELEIRSPVGGAISSFGLSASGPDSTAETTESAPRAFTGYGPGIVRARRSNPGD